MSELMCPFCKSDYIDTVEVECLAHAAMCRNCGAMGPQASTKKGASERWNRRDDSATAELRRELEEVKAKAVNYAKEVRECRRNWDRKTQEAVDAIKERDTLKREVEELRSRIMWLDFTEALPRPFQLVFVERKDGSAGRAVWDGAYWLMDKDHRGHASEIEVIRWRNILDAEAAALNQREK